MLSVLDSTNRQGIQGLIMITEEMMKVLKFGGGYRQKSGKRGRGVNRSPNLLMLLIIANTEQLPYSHPKEIT